jgi:hypothetical protein
MPVPEDLVSALMTLQSTPEGFKVFRFTEAAKTAITDHLPGVELTSGGDHELFAREDEEAILFIPDDLLEAHDPPMENNANAPEDVLRTMVVVSPEGPANPEFVREILQALQSARVDLAPQAAQGAGKKRRRKTRKAKGKRKTTRRRKGLRG